MEVLNLPAGPRPPAGPSVSGLIIAAGELAGLTVLYRESVFDLIASVTGQPAEWLIAS